ncbi:MAG: peptidase [Clostridiaceae bacterium]|nr:peptidase [Clostridiaceae bacterium]
MRMILVFIDGIGIGKNDLLNPFIKANIPNWHSFINNHSFFEADASLGVSGLPQSATGQASIYTGQNAPKAVGRHISARPTSTLVEMVSKDNIFKMLINRGYTVTFANVYTRETLEKLGKEQDEMLKPSVTTLLNLSAALPFRTVEDYRNGDGVYHDITGEALREKGYDVPLITPEKAAENLYRLSRNFDFTLFEFFVSDFAGHSQDMDKAVAVLERLDRFLGALAEHMDLSKEVLVIVSDHGNIEDLSVPTHTMNPVPVLFITKTKTFDKGKITAITDILPAVLDFFPGKKHS